MTVKKFNLKNDEIEVKFIPELGGRVSSLVNKRTGKEWVWKDPRLSTRKVEEGQDYDDNWQGGWEELFPNDAIENFSWGPGFDHGELWFKSWELLNLSENNATLEIKNLESGARIIKSFSIENNKFTSEYKGEVKFKDYFLFKLHIAIPLTERLNIKLQQKDMDKVVKNFGNILKTEEHEKFLNPERNSGLYDFAYIDITDNEIVLMDEKKDQLKLTYDNNFFKYFWIFQSQGGWMNRNVVVLEPCTNGRKLISEAADKEMSIKGPLEFNTKFSVELTKS